MPPELSLARFWTPRYWPTWVLLGALHVAARLPIRWQLGLGRGLGHFLLPLNPRQRRVARRNIELCFPELDSEQRQALLVRHFEAVGMSFVEMGVGWFVPIAKLLERVEIFGRELPFFPWSFAKSSSSNPTTLLALSALSSCFYRSRFSLS